MPDILLAADETAATQLVADAQATLGTIGDSGSGSLGPFDANWSANVNFTGGTVDLLTPDIVRLADVNMNFSLSFSFSIDLSDILPDFCLPQVCISIPFIGEVCTPEICVDWPTIGPIPINYSDTLKFTSDFRLVTQLDGAEWVISIEIVGIPNLQFGPIAAAILVLLGAAITPFLLVVPFIGPFLAIAVNGILALIGIAGLTGFLGPILSLFVSGLTFEIYRQPQLFEVLPASLPLDPQVAFIIDNMAAEVRSSDEDELVVTVEISAP